MLVAQNHKEILVDDYTRGFLLAIPSVGAEHSIAALHYRFGSSQTSLSRDGSSIMSITLRVAALFADKTAVFEHQLCAAFVTMFAAPRSVPDVFFQYACGNPGK